ncbi:serine/threonine-protein kinase, partial [Tautonia rosea]|uniref:serine/threonine-protein kinase n=1 Tax=Tautonia rosea TaxID=2728037 RepID=UPI001475A6D5
MPSALADRNLLYGLLALQMDFVSKDELIDAMQAWALDKQTPLEQILQDRGHLAPEDHDALERMLRRHLARHGDNPQRSLAAVAVDPEVHDGLRSLADPEVVASLGHVPTPPATPMPATASLPTSDDPEATASYTGPSPEQERRRYRVVRPHARGGLGEVSVALDTELNREVALKQILGLRADGDADRRRFVFEAEVTGGLEHPGIVPVYSLGNDPETGRPYYAMRFIRGDSLRDAIAAYHADEAKRAGPSERSLGLRRLLSQFIDACNAIAYAHDRGVLHRDLKPANIMVGKYGETLVVDWGLAKVVGRPEEPTEPRDEPSLRPPSGSDLQETLPGSALGTPQYMPPEQAEGRLDMLGPPSDVYSLGATLYTILVGRPAFPQESTAEVLAAVRRGDFAPPRSVDPAIPRSLEAICLKAMALRPEDRYGSAKALAEDLEHWLADEPVAARPDPPLVRAGRWARRHKPLVAGAAGLLLAAVVGLAVGATLLGRANRRITENYELAEANYELAREAVDNFYTKVSEDTLLNQPHMEPLRRDLLQSAREFYERFTARRAEDPEARADLGRALRLLAMIDDALGSMPDAITSSERAVALFRDLAAAHPEVPDYRRELARNQHNLGYTYFRTGQLSEAESLYTKAREMQEQLAAAHPEVPDYRRDLAISHQNLGYLYSTTGRAGEAEASYRAALTLQERLSEEHPEVPYYRTGLATNHQNLGNLYSDTGRMAEAEASYQAALTLLERLSEEHPEVPDYRNRLAANHQNLGNLSRITGRMAEAEASYQAALAL